MEREQRKVESSEAQRRVSKVKGLLRLLSKTHPEIVSAFGFEEACGKNVETVSN